MDRATLAKLAQFDTPRAGDPVPPGVVVRSWGRSPELIGETTTALPYRILKVIENNPEKFPRCVQTWWGEPTTHKNRNFYVFMFNTLYYKRLGRH